MLEDRVAGWLIGGRKWLINKANNKRKRVNDKKE